MIRKSSAVVITRCLRPFLCVHFVGVKLQSRVKMSATHDTVPVSAADAAPASDPSRSAAVIGKRVNGKNWRPTKKAFRPTAGQTSYEKRKAADALRATMRAKEQEMKDEKQADRDRRIQAIKDKRKAKEEKERYEAMAAKMHQKLVERRKRREKRNKLLKS